MLPQQITGYSQLRHLDMTGCCALPGSTLPAWFSQLTQLDTLRAHVQMLFSKFPKCVLQLKQLSSVDLARNAFHFFDLPVDVFRFSEFTALTRLD